MLSGSAGHNYDPMEGITTSRLKVQTSILKAIHDFLEEQDFLHILPNTLKSLSHQFFNPLQIDNDLSSSNLKKSNLSEHDDIVINHQLLIGKLEISRLYSITTRMEKFENTSFLDMEFENLNFYDTFVFLEKMMRRIKVDIETKDHDSVSLLNGNFKKWENNFPVISRHDIELEFGDDWRKEATIEFDSPFFISCVEPEFYDVRDPERIGNHYLNFELYFPNLELPVAKGSEREFRYHGIIQRMADLGINRFEYRNYLLNVAEGKLSPSSGTSVYLDNLVDAYISQKN